MARCSSTGPPRSTRWSIRSARKLGYAGRGDADDIAAGVLTLANAQMATAIKEITIERGKDIRDFDLFVFGGGGPLHGVSLARELHIPRVIVPPEPGNFSALGMLLADARIDEPFTFLADLDDSDRRRPARSARDAAQQGPRHARARFRRGPPDLRAAGRYALQGPAPRHPRLRSRTATTSRRSEKSSSTNYRRRYGRADAESPIEFIGISVTGFALTDRPKLDGLHRAGTEPAGVGRRGGRYISPRCAPGSTRRSTGATSLPVGFRLSGPAVIEEFGATTVIGPRERLEVGALGELRIELS